MLEKFDSFYEMLSANDSNDEPFTHLKEMATEFVDTFRERNIIKNIEIVPNDMIGSSVIFRLYALPENIVIKIWIDSGIYYVAMFRQHIENRLNECNETIQVRTHFDIKLEETFNQSGILSFKTLDEVEDIMINFLVNQHYSKSNTVIM